MALKLLVKYFHEHFVFRKKCLKKIETVKLMKNGMYLNLRTGGVIKSYYPKWALYLNYWVTNGYLEKYETIYVYDTKMKGFKLANILNFSKIQIELKSKLA